MLVFKCIAGTERLHGCKRVSPAVTDPNAGIILFLD